jgi:hypothetical protein
MSPYSDPVKIGELVKIEELVKMLQAERVIELNQLHSREQWFWVPYFGFLAGTVAALASAHSVVYVSLPVVFGIIVSNICWSRRKGLKISMAALEYRHATFVRLVAENKQVACLSFDFRGDDPQGTIRCRWIHHGWDSEVPR